MAARRLAAALGRLLSRQGVQSSRLLAAGAAVTGVCAYGLFAKFSRDRAPRPYSLAVLYAAAPLPAADQCESDHLRHRQKRFLDFASLVYKGEAYMTPQDFLLSVTQEDARDRKFRVEVDESTVHAWLKKTPAKSKQMNERFFRYAGDHGLISFVEYLFLLCILTEPGSRFELAFDMFDLDGNKLVDRHEFSVLAKIFAVPQLLTPPAGREGSAKESETDVQPAPDGALIIPTRRSFQDLKKELSAESSSPSTTLAAHFFGWKGKEVLSHDEFARFSEGLQREVLVVEFYEFSHGLHSISELDFARILLRYTKLPAAKLEECLDRVRAKTADPRGIKLSDFQQFCLFLNHLDDFILMMRLYNLSNLPISAEEFRRAVNVCTGLQISEHVIRTVFAMFDVDGDGNLSQSEFISIMKSRLKRGLRSHLKSSKKTVFENFKRCLKQEITHS